MQVAQETPDILVKLWKVIVELHGTPTARDRSSQAASLRMFLALTEYPVSEDEAMSKIRADREGALSLFSVTFRRAGMGGYSVSSLRQLQLSEMPEIKLDSENFVCPLMLNFYNTASMEYPYSV